jgi:signal transduction histidine kinase
LEAIREFRGMPPRFLPAYAAGGLAIVAIVFFDYVVPSVNARISAMSWFFAIISALCCVTLFRKMPAGRKFGMTLTGGMFAIWTVTYLGRAIYFQLAPSYSSLFSPSWINVTFLMGSTVGVVWCSVGFILMTDERVMLELKDAENRTVRANRELAEAIERATSLARLAAAANAAKSESVAIMSHEIRNPLSGVLAMTDMLLATELAQEHREYLEAVRRSVEGLLTLTGDVLDLSKIEAGRLTIESQAFDLRAAIEDATRIFAPIAQAKGIALLFEYPAGIPRHFIGDAARVRQVIMNLAGNALKFTSAGHIRVIADCEAQDAQSAQMRISVADTGIGIPPEKMGSLFETFSQAHVTTARKYGGTGLGLAISKKLIELMGGSIRVESVVGKGSTFWLTMPLPIEIQRKPEVAERK